MFGLLGNSEIGLDPLPEDVVRDIIANGWRLQEAKGCDEGVRLGLSLLGMVGEIEHWWQVEPRRAPNTHRVTFYLCRQLCSGATLGAREISAAERMIKATKRWSQDSDVIVGARGNGRCYVGALSTSYTHVVAGPLPTEFPSIFATAQVGVATVTHVRVVARPL